MGKILKAETSISVGNHVVLPYGKRMEDVELSARMIQALMRAGLVREVPQTEKFEGEERLPVEKDLETRSLTLKETLEGENKDLSNLTPFERETLDHFNEGVGLEDMNHNQKEAIKRIERKLGRSLTGEPDEGADYVGKTE